MTFFRPFLTRSESIAWGFLGLSHEVMECREKVLEVFFNLTFPDRF